MLQVREYKADLAKLQESAKAAGSAASGGAAARAELGLVDDYSQTSAGQRERLLQTTDKMGRTGERITQGRQQLLETEVPHSCLSYLQQKVLSLMASSHESCSKCRATRSRDGSIAWVC